MKFTSYCPHANLWNSDQECFLINVPPSLKSDEQQLIISRVLFVSIDVVPKDLSLRVLLLSLDQQSRTL